jgi:predicted Zn finger-like uncharacterized protein
MIVICEECGKKYKIDPARIKGKAARFRCKACDHVITVQKPNRDPAESAQITPSAVGQTDRDVGSEPERGSAGEPEKRFESSLRAVPQFKRSGFGLRAKMFWLFLVIPIVLMAAASGVFLWQLERMASLLTTQSSRIVQEMAEEKIADVSAAVAQECRLYLLAHPELTKDNFFDDIGFRSLAVQKVGLTGYTALYEIPGQDGVWRTWAHVNSKIIGIDMSRLNASLGRNFAGFWKIFTGVKEGKKSQGYYTWQDKDGSFRDKFMVCTPVAGTPYVIAATTYLDEFTGPVKQMESRANILTKKTRTYIWAVLAGTLLLVGLIVSVYGHRLTGKIRSLTDVAERISVGELEIEIETASRDELGELAEAISRMQDSIRLSIERLRRRR